MRFLFGFSLRLATVCLGAVIHQTSYAQAFIACEQLDAHATSEATRGQATFLASGDSMAEATVERLFEEVTTDPFWGRLGTTTSLRIIDSKTPNAFLKNSTKVVIASGLLDSLESADELRYIIAHEIAHLALRHTSSSSQRAEIEADALAISYIQHMGIGPCGPIRLLERLRKQAPIYSIALATRLETLQRKFGVNCIVSSPSPTAMIAWSDLALTP